VHELDFELWYLFVFGDELKKKMLKRWAMMPDPFVTAIYVYNMYMCISQAKNIHVAIHDVMTEPHKIIIYSC